MYCGTCSCKNYEDNSFTQVFKCTVELVLVKMMLIHSLNHFTHLWYEFMNDTGPVFIKHLKSNVYVTLNAIGSFRCNLCSHWLIQIVIT